MKSVEQESLYKNYLTLSGYFLHKFRYNGSIKYLSKEGIKGVKSNQVQTSSNTGYKH